MSETRSVETSATDIETAIELGLDQLGVSRESVIVEILEEPSRGLLGLGAKQARVRLTTAAPPRQAAPPPQPEPVARAYKAAPEPVRVADLDDDQPGDTDQGGAQGDDQDDDQYTPITPASPDEMDDDARVGLETLQELLGKMQITADVTVYRAPVEDDEEDSPWVLQIEGHDLGTLIGRRGETLSALQYVTRLIASRELQRRANIVLDVEGYKMRREQKLHQLAQRMAEQALQLGRTVALEPMSPYERRIIHLALRDNPDVSTESVGEGERRKVTIIPNRR
ncbi:MAG: Jag N-terminal domain-containing protein [Anaerolineae bacterium]|nr:Jag N-terminal domain-containing protein [Anaerolineae bacterium]